MVFLFILDVITSVSMRIVVNCGTWIAYKSANGACYLYRKLMPQKQHETHNNRISTQQFVPDDAAYVLITRDEYDRMKSSLIV